MAEKFEYVYFVLSETIEIDEDLEECRNVSFSNGWCDYGVAKEYFNSSIKAIRSRYDFYETIRYEALSEDRYEAHFKDGSKQKYTLKKMYVHAASEVKEN